MTGIYRGSTLISDIPPLKQQRFYEEFVFTRVDADKIIVTKYSPIDTTEKKSFLEAKSGWDHVHSKRAQDIVAIQTRISELLEIVKTSEFENLSDTFKELHTCQKVVELHELELRVPIDDKYYTWTASMIETSFTIERGVVYIDQENFFAGSNMDIIIWIDKPPVYGISHNKIVHNYSCTEKIGAHIDDETVYNNSINISDSVKSITWYVDPSCAKGGFILLINKKSICSHFNGDDIELPQEQNLRAKRARTVKLYLSISNLWPINLKTSALGGSYVLIIMSDNLTVVLSKYNKDDNSLRTVYEFTCSRQVTDIALSTDHVYIMRNNTIYVYNIETGAQISHLTLTDISMSTINMIYDGKKQYLFGTGLSDGNAACLIDITIDGRMTYNRFIRDMPTYNAIVPSPWPTRLLGIVDGFHYRTISIVTSDTSPAQMIVSGIIRTPLSYVDVCKNVYTKF